MTTLQKVRTSAVDKPRDERSAEELAAREVVQLPEREALSVAFPLVGPLGVTVGARGTETIADSLEDAVIESDV